VHLVGFTIELSVRKPRALDELEQQNRDTLPVMLLTH